MCVVLKIEMSILFLVESKMFEIKFGKAQHKIDLLLLSGLGQLARNLHIVWRVCVIVGCGWLLHCIGNCIGNYILYRWSFRRLYIKSAYFLFVHSCAFSAKTCCIQMKQLKKKLCNNRMQIYLSCAFGVIVDLASSSIWIFHFDDYFLFFFWFQPFVDQQGPTTQQREICSLCINNQLDNPWSAILHVRAPSTHLSLSLCVSRTYDHFGHSLWPPRIHLHFHIFFSFDFVYGLDMNAHCCDHNFLHFCMHFILLSSARGILHT